MGKQLREAGALAIRNIGVIEQAYKLIDEQITVEIFFIVEKIIGESLPKEWVKILPYLDSHGQFGDGSWFAPQEWRDGDKEDWSGCFEVWAEAPEGGSEWNLTQLCGQGESEMGFRWSSDNRLEMSKGVWKKFAFQQHGKRPDLAKLGFRYEEKNGSWFIPLLVDENRLADAYAEEDMESVLEPAIKRCLNCILQALPEFNSIIEEAKGGSR